MNSVTYGAWVMYAVKVTGIVAVITLILNVIIYRNEFTYLLKKIMKKA